MQIETHRVNEADTTLDAFADNHGLIMEVRERTLDRWARERNIPRFIASFKHAEVKGDGVLSSMYGDGDTPEVAITNYAQQIRGETLVINAYTQQRREVRCPNEWISR